ncbi:MAG: SLBB domain-containing protein [bacterium]|nr:SLBB domain-containing protein [bacterium]
MFKKIITMFILVAFSFMLCPVSIVFAATDDIEANITQKGDVFENNFQTIKDADSSVEQMYNKRESAISGEPLKQIGYQFSTTGAQGSTSVGKFGADYKLSLGDRLNVLSYGESVDVMSMTGANVVAPASQVTVDSNGSVFIPGVGLVRAENRTLGEVENEVNRIANTKFKNINIKLTLSSETLFSVFIYGEVNHPGKVYISSNSSIYDALGAAGGVKKSGSLRNITYNGKSGAIDLYDSILFGNDRNIILKANDKIFVPKIGNTAAVRNGVPVPGIYELKKGETIDDLIRFAGGFLVTTNPDSFVLVGFDKVLGQKAGKTFEWKSAKNHKLANGDTIEFKEYYNGVENLVALQGNIKHPATFVWKEGMKLSDILKSENELLDDTFMNQAVIRRISGSGNNVEIIPVYLQEFFKGMNDPKLMPRDVITIYKNTSSKFVDVYGCVNAPKHMIYRDGMSLADIVSNMKFLVSEVEEPVDNSNEFPAALKTANLQTATAAKNANLIPTENVAVEITRGSETFTYYLYDVMIKSNEFVSINIQPEDKVFFRTLRDDEAIKTVKISGYVATPAVYTFIKGQKLTDVIKMAGGLTDDADLRGIVYSRDSLKGKQTAIAMENNERDIKLLQGHISGAKMQTEEDKSNKLQLISMLKDEEGSLAKRYNGRIALNIKSNNLNKISKVDNIAVMDGDSIYIPRIANYVSVIGEVYNEQTFTYLRGAGPKAYLKNAGGYTPNANKYRKYRVGVNGKAQRISIGTKVKPGDTIVVPRKIAGNDWITPLCSTLQAVASILAGVFVITKI